MNQKRWIGVAIIILVVLLSGFALILVNFSSMTSQLEHNSQMVSSSGSQNALPQLNNSKTALYVNANDRLKNALQIEVTRLLQGRPEFGQIEVVESLENNAGLPLLVVEVEPQDLLWTPIYARAALKVNVAYASDGDVSFRQTVPVEFKHTTDQLTVKRSGIYTFNDASWGLISNPGYMNYLGRVIAAAIANDLQGQ